MDGYLAKPFRAEELYAVLHQITALSVQDSPAAPQCASLQV